MAIAMAGRWVSANFGSSAWLLLAPAAPLVAACVPHRLPKLYFDMHLRRLVRRMLPFLDPFVTIDICRKPASYSADRIKSSDAYEEVKAYLSAACGRDARQLQADGAADGDGFVLGLREGQEVSDEFRGVTIWWASVKPGKESSDHCLRLTFHQRHRGLVVKDYLPHVRRGGRDVMFGNQRRRLYTNKKTIDYCGSNKVWRHIDFDHPITFETLAMHPAKKRRIMDDLDDFRSNKDYYRRIGKAWKRGYLLYGPPGTGKSTMIAAMANYLNYDIYDIELTMVQSNNDLRKLFIETTGKSIIVIEDIDCSLDLSGSRASADIAGSLPAAAQAAVAASLKRKRATSDVTLSGLLNFIDGLWSAHSGERIIVFTTNFIDKLDPALIRRGRMDMHVEMSYCGFEAFKTLAKNYLGVDSHPLFDTVGGLLEAVEITPADVAECLMMSKRTDRGAETCLQRLIDELKNKAAEKEAAKKKAAEEEAAAAAKPSDTPKRRKVVDPKAIRRAVKKDGGAATAKKPSNGKIAVGNGGTTAANGGAIIDLSDDESIGDDHGDGEAKADADVEVNGREAMATDGGAVSVAADGGIGDAEDYEDDDDGYSIDGAIDDYDNDDDFGDDSDDDDDDDDSDDLDDDY